MNKIKEAWKTMQNELVELRMFPEDAFRVERPKNGIQRFSIRLCPSVSYGEEKASKESMKALIAGYPWSDEDKKAEINKLDQEIDFVDWKIETYGTAEDEAVAMTEKLRTSKPYIKFCRVTGTGELKAEVKNDLYFYLIIERN